MGENENEVEKENVNILILRKDVIGEVERGRRHCHKIKKMIRFVDPAIYAPLSSHALLSKRNLF